MDTVVDHLFSAEVGLAPPLRRATLARWVAARARQHKLDLGASFSLVLLMLGFRRTREAMQHLAAGVQDMVAPALHMLRISSVPAMVGEAASSGAASGGWRRLGHFKSSHPSLATLDGSSSSAAPVSSSAETKSTQVVAQGSSSGAERMAAYISERLDFALMTLLGYKLALLVMYTMPSEWFFGIKRRFLRWASRAALFRMYLRFAPFLSVGIVAAGTAAVRFSRHPLQQATVHRWRALALLNTVLTFCTARLFELVRGDPAPFLYIEETAQDRDLLSARPPPVSLSRAIAYPQSCLTPPVFLGLEQIPSEGKRILFVGNHVICGLDGLLLLAGLHGKAGIWARPLGEHAWFSVPVLGEVVKYWGGIDGTRHNCDLLMQRGDCILVYPGGAREAWKRTTDPKYAILWGEDHLGFVRMAVRHGYTIVPVASVGLEDVVEPVADLPIRRILTAGNMFPTPSKGTSKAFDQGARFPLIWPRLLEAQRCYYRFMPPITTAEYTSTAGADEDMQLLRRLRDETKIRLQAGIDALLEYRSTDPERFVFKRRRGAAADASRARL
eukprot:TRINITY_DN21651_c0_g1_i1.p1 TRINITY_DN21651_c0_g1~~TRINITY_DN21651_c0_g1_i1.p1  ORF type:complete len:565 (-),score=87.11 TRINITY_DN21651_c0_g1_i1:136-1806(-)